MNFKIALIFLGVATLAAAAGKYHSRVRVNPNPTPAPVKTYGQPMVQEQEEIQEEPVEYKQAVKQVTRAPIRVAATEPLVSNYASNSYSSPSPAASLRTSQENDRITDEQNKNAKYAFGSAIDDGIMDHSHVRQETRDGLKVEGSYAYSDGYFKRVVNYVADEGGYRVVSDSVEEINEDGPKIDLVNGKADVHTQISGVDNQYSVSAHEIGSLNKNTKQ